MFEASLKPDRAISAVIGIIPVGNGVALYQTMYHCCFRGFLMIPRYKFQYPFAVCITVFTVTFPRYFFSAEVGRRSKSGIHDLSGNTANDISPRFAVSRSLLQNYLYKKFPNIRPGNCGNRMCSICM